MPCRNFFTIPETSAPSDPENRLFIISIVCVNYLWYRRLWRTILRKNFIPALGVGYFLFNKPFKSKISAMILGWATTYSTSAKLTSPNWNFGAMELLLRRCETPPSPPASDPVGIENCKQLFSPLLAFTTQEIATHNTDIISAVCVAFFLRRKCKP